MVRKIEVDLEITLKKGGGVGDFTLKEFTKLSQENRKIVDFLKAKLRYIKQ